MPRRSRTRVAVAGFPRQMRRSRGLGRTFVRFVSVGATLTSTIALLPTPASADANSDRAKVTQLGERIAQDGAKVQRLVVSYDQAQAHEAAVTAQLGPPVRISPPTAAPRPGRRPPSTARPQQLHDRCRRQSTLSLFDSGNVTAMSAEQEYTQVATDGLNNAIDAVNVDKQNTQSTETQLQSAQS